MNMTMETTRTTPPASVSTGIRSLPSWLNETPEDPIDGYYLIATVNGVHEQSIRIYSREQFITMKRFYLKLVRCGLGVLTEEGEDAVVELASEKLRVTPAETLDRENIWYQLGFFEAGDGINVVDDMTREQFIAHKAFHASLLGQRLSEDEAEEEVSFRHSLAVILAGASIAARLTVNPDGEAPDPSTVDDVETSPWDTPKEDPDERMPGDGYQFVMMENETNKDRIAISREEYIFGKYATERKRSLATAADDSATSWNPKEAPFLEVLRSIVADGDRRKIKYDSASARRARNTAAAKVAKTKRPN